MVHGDMADLERRQRSSERWAWWRGPRALHRNAHTHLTVVRVHVFVSSHAQTHIQRAYPSAVNTRENPCLFRANQLYQNINFLITYLVTL